ncbi:MAG: tetratricopeptide repeat protein [Pseudomonadota bacterium]
MAHRPPALAAILALALALPLALALAAPAPALAGALDDMNASLAVDDIASGLAARHRGDQSGAIKRFTQAIDSGGLAKENLAVAHNNRGNAYDDQGQPDQALKDYDQAIKLDPRLAEAYYNRAFVLYRVGRLQEALDDLDKVVQLLPNLPSAYYNRSVVLESLGQNNRAMSDLQQALGLDPVNAKYRDNLERLQAATVTKKP